MHVQDFVKVYESKSDEELIQLDANLEQLTSAARLALQGELSRRRISIPEHALQHEEACMTLAKESSDKYCKRASGVASAILWLKFLSHDGFISI